MEVGLSDRDRGLCIILAPATNCMAFICKKKRGDGDMTVSILYIIVLFLTQILRYYQQIKKLYIFRLKSMMVF